MIEQSAPGKVILFGEHAVVYGRPALAAPLSAIRATAALEERPAGTGLTFQAHDLGLSLSLSDSTENGIALMAALVLDWLGQDEPDAVVHIRSNIPVAAGLGSGAAVSAAVGRVGGLLGSLLGASIIQAGGGALIVAAPPFQKIPGTRR